VPQGNRSGSPAALCYEGLCECADPTQERVLWAGSNDESPCWRCVTPPEVVSLRLEEEPETSCLVRAPRSKLPRAGSSSSLEPVLRLVMTSEDNADGNLSCAAFVREGDKLRERNTSLCLSWSPSGSVWGLGKCAAEGLPEVRLQSFQKREDASEGRKSSVFCTSVSDENGEGREVDDACITLRDHICTAEAGLCTAQSCRCEDSSWIKHEASLEGGGMCWSCAPQAILHCSTEPRVCTTAECECEDPSYEKIQGNTSGSPMRECWSCHPKGGHRKSLFYRGGTAAGALIAIFSCGLLGGLALRRFGEGEPSLAQKSKAQKALRPLTWYDWLALELEELKATAEDGASLVVHLTGQACEVALSPVSRCWRSAAVAVAPHIKSFGEWVNAGTSQVSAALSADADGSQGVSSAHGATDDAAPSQASSSSKCSEEQSQQPLPPTVHEQDRSLEEAQEEEDTGKAQEAELQPCQSEQSEASKRRRRAQKAKDAKAPAPLLVPEPEEERSSASSSSAFAAGSLVWDELGLANGEDKSGIHQHARLLMLLRAQPGLEVDKRSMAAKWLLMHHTLPACQPAAPESTAPEFEAATSSRSGRRRARGGKKSASNETGAYCSAADTEAADDAEVGAAWDPLGLQKSRDETRQGLHQARVLMLGVPSWCEGTAGKMTPRALTASWLLLNHMRESGVLEKLRGRQTPSESSQQKAAETVAEDVASPAKTCQRFDKADSLFPESNIKVSRTFIEVAEPGDEDHDTPLASRLKKSVSCGDVPALC